MKFRNKFLFLGLIIIFLFITDLTIGSVKISFSEFFYLLTHQQSPLFQIFMQIRLPRAITAVLTGISLPVAGLLLQTLFANPLAGPYIFGISAGSGLGVAIVLMAGGIAGGFLASLGIVTASISGAIAVLALISFLAWRLKNNLTVLITGIFIGSGISAIINLMQYFSDKQDLKNFVIWTMGSLDILNLSDVFLYAIFVVIIFIAILFNSKNFDALYLGEENAQTLGVNVNRTRLKIFIFTGILTGVTTSFCGPIAFIGIAVPHITRLIFKEILHFKLMILSAMTGVVIMLVSDILAHSFSVVIPLNSITALLGIPVIIWIAIKNNV